MTNSRSDGALAEVEAEHGLEMYGFWWRILEIVGEKMNQKTPSSCTYSSKVWAKFAGISPKKFIKFANILGEKKLIILKNDQNSITIDIPNMVRFRDEYTRKQSEKSG